MTKEWADHGFVLRIGRFRETDIWLKTLCRTRGIATLFAFGASRSRRRFCGCLDVLNTLHCHIRTAGNGHFFNLQEAVLLAGPQRLRRNWQRMGLAANCLRFVETLGVPPENATEAFELVEDLRYTMENAPYLPPLLPLFFRLRMAGASGLAPGLQRCGRCGASLDGEVLFLADEGQARCPRCRPAYAAYATELSNAGLSLLRHVLHTAPSAWPCDDMPLPERRACAKAIDGFVQYHLGIAFEEGRFRRI
ncbi:MAG: DNA repair protein RecO C-terminal domain-containing protein [Desulfovibrio sp.]|jgi:DNA repair protein RecO (recombination protein O)|nr:DNA repair protein RecO C-terminal domain-containing protein [Desulfovibrio sp.]